MKRYALEHLYTALVVGIIAGAILGAGISLHVHKGVLASANSERDTCVSQLLSYRQDTKAEIHAQLQTLSTKYLVLDQDAFIDILNGATVDLRKEYSNLYEGEFPQK